MKLSIVIVNYNVRYFLEQCLQSVYKALEGIDAEVFVVDNHSVDGSVAMVEERFPQVVLIANKDNPGFSRANNQAIRRARGEYVLLLNPDTVVEENTFRSSLAFMDRHPQAGGLGIKMIDGQGRYLPESKRGLPTPWVAFCKIFGLSRLFPRSPRLARYYLGHLSENENQEVEILAGAYMLLRKKALDEIGLLDEDYFMYGEDIDLSYRLLKAGYKNYYLAESRIIHYKGESTKKGSLNYVFVFYRAMIIFAEKHFGGSYARFYTLFIRLAIYLRAGLAIARRLWERLWLPLSDAALLLAGLLYIKWYWENNHRFISGGAYPDSLVQIAFPLYVLAWLAGLYSQGGYDRNQRLGALFKGVAFGTIAILVVYSLVPEEYRFSRAIIMLGAVWAALIIPLWRYLLSRSIKPGLLAGPQREKRLAIIGEEAEARRVQQLLESSGEKAGFVAWVSPQGQGTRQHLGEVDQLPEICRVFEVEELIFCAQSMPSKTIMQQMGQLQELAIPIKIAPPESQFVIGSHSIQAPGDWYTVPLNSISRPANRRNKRLMDLLIGLLALPLLLFWGFGRLPAGRSWRDWWRVMRGKYTWLAYDLAPETEHLPPLKPGIIPVSARQGKLPRDLRLAEQLNQLYAQDYRPEKDLSLFWQNWTLLGQSGQNRPGGPST